MSEATFQQKKQSQKRHGRPPKGNKLTKSDSRYHQSNSPISSNVSKSNSFISGSVPPKRDQFRFNKTSDDDSSSDTLTIDTSTYHKHTHLPKKKIVVDDDVQSVLTSAFREIMGCDKDHNFTEVNAPSFTEVNAPSQSRQQLMKRVNPFREGQRTSEIPRFITLPTSRAMAHTWNALVSNIKTEFESDIQNGTAQPDNKITDYHNLMMFVSFCTNISSVVIENIRNIVISGVATIDTMFQSYKVLLILSVDESDQKCLFVFRDTDKQFNSHRLASVECENGFANKNGVSYYKMKLINRTHSKKTETTYVFTHENERDMFSSKIHGRF